MSRHVPCLARKLISKTSFAGQDNSIFGKFPELLYFYIFLFFFLRPKYETAQWPKLGTENMRMDDGGGIWGENDHKKLTDIDSPTFSVSTESPNRGEREKNTKKKKSEIKGKQYLEMDGPLISFQSSWLSVSVTLTRPIFFGVMA